MTQEADAFYRLSLEAFERKDVKAAYEYLAQAIDAASIYDTTYLWERVELAGDYDDKREIPEQEIKEILSDLGEIISNTSNQLKAALLKRTLWHIRSGTVEDIERDLDELIALGEDHYRWRASYRAQRGDDRGALEDVSQAYERNKDWQHLLGRGFHSYKVGLYERAIEDYTTILSTLLDDKTQASTYGAVYYHLGRAYYKKGQSGDALKAFQEMSRYRGTPIYPELNDYSSEFSTD